MRIAGPDHLLRYKLVMNVPELTASPKEPVNDPVLFESLAKQYDGSFWASGAEGVTVWEKQDDGSIDVEIRDAPAEYLFYHLNEGTEEFRYVPKTHDGFYDNHYTRTGPSIQCTLFSDDLKNDPFRRFYCRFSIKPDTTLQSSKHDVYQNAQKAQSYSAHAVFADGHRERAISYWFDQGLAHLLYNSLKEKPYWNDYGHLEKDGRDYACYQEGKAAPFIYTCGFFFDAKGGVAHDILFYRQHGTVK